MVTRCPGQEHYQPYPDFLPGYCRCLARRFGNPPLLFPCPAAPLLKPLGFQGGGYHFLAVVMIHPKYEGEKSDGEAGE